jgi:hypothetical protein
MVGKPEVILGQDLFAGQVVSDESSDAVDQRGASAVPQVIVARAGNEVQLLGFVRPREQGTSHPNWRLVVGEILSKHMGVVDLKPVFPGFDNNPRKFLGLVRA